MCVCVCDSQPLQLVGGETVRPPLPSCLRRELSSGQCTVGGGGSSLKCVCVYACMAMCVVFTCMFEHVCECICVMCLDQGAVAAAGSTSCVFVSELDPSAVVLTLP